MSIARFVDVIVLSAPPPMFSRFTILIWKVRQLNSPYVVCFSCFPFQDRPFRFRKSSSTWCLDNASGALRLVGAPSQGRHGMDSFSNGSLSTTAP
jgi:hypothetical protein